MFGLGKCFQSEISAPALGILPPEKRARLSLPQNTVMSWLFIVSHCKTCFSDVKRVFKKRPNWKVQLIVLQRVVHRFLRRIADSWRVYFLNTNTGPCGLPNWTTVNHTGAECWEVQVRILIQFSFPICVPSRVESRKTCAPKIKTLLEQITCMGPQYGLGCNLAIIDRINCTYSIRPGLPAKW